MDKPVFTTQREIDIMRRLQEHYDEAKQIFPEDQIVGIFLQGSQNYELDMEGSDVDSKLILLPSLDDIIFAREPVSSTHVRENDEHIDFKDIRLMFKTFRKQNINFVEILFTKYRIINPMYEDLWNEVYEDRELIARYDVTRALQTMQGMAHEKQHAMEHMYPSRQAIIEANGGYDPKQLHHMLRLEDFIDRYIAGEPYEKCLIPLQKEYLKAVKKGVFDIKGARMVADETIQNIDKTVNAYKANNPSNPNPEVDIILDSVQGAIMKKSIIKKLKEDLN